MHSASSFSVRPAARRPALRSQESGPAIEQAIERALERLGDAPATTREWVEALRDLCVRGGKRIRPKLCALAYEGLAGRPLPGGVFTFAAGLELLHVFMLVHDDLIDGADTRRGAPTLHRHPRLEVPRDPSGQLKRDLAMVSGDMLFALAVETMLAAELPAARLNRAMSVVLATAREAALGEFLDMRYAVEPLGSLSSADLADVLRLKTANYTFVGPLVAGALLAGATPQTERALTSFGERVGVAFQLADDLLDLYGEERQLGKPTGGDVREGKRTVLMRLALDRAEAGDRARLESILDSRAASADDVAWVGGLVRRTGVASEVAQRVRTLVRAANRSLSRAGLQPSATQHLKALAQQVASGLPELEPQRTDSAAVEVQP